MSELILPSYMVPTFQPREEPDADADGEEKARALPEPQGWKILCIVPRLEDKYENTNIVRPESFARLEEHATTVLFVLKVGPLAYKDPAKYGDRPWCKEGDFILTRTYSGTRFKIYSQEFRLLNDDMVEAVVQDPRGLTRAY